MIERILVAVDDSAPALAAAAVATGLAEDWGAELHFVAVTEPEHPAAVAVAHAVRRARDAGLEPRASITDGGPPFEVLLEVAKEWRADLIVMGRSDSRRPGVPYVGSQTEHLLEFADVPVLVVPHAPPPDEADRVRSPGVRRSSSPGGPSGRPGPGRG